MTTVFAKRDARCPFSAAIEMIERLHQSSTDHIVGPFSRMRMRVHCDFAEVRDYTDETRVHEALVLQWKSHAALPLPLMRGMITVRPNGPFTELRMEGTYVPPLGFAGAVFDTLIGKRIAQRTIERFLDELRDFVEQQWDSDRRGVDARIGTKP
jgi:hypothetical protein